MDPELDEALQRVEAAPDDPVLRHKLGRLLERAGHPADALPHLEEAVRLAPGDADAWYMLGVSAHRSNLPGRAREALGKLIELDESAPHRLAERAKLLRLLGDTEQAIETAERALALAANPNLVSWLHLMLADCREILGDLDGALHSARAALAATPNNPHALHLVGCLLVDRADYQEALPLFRKAVELEPEPGYNWYALGHAANRDGDWVTAREAMEQAISRDYDTYSTRLGLGWALQNLGELKPAREAFDLAVGLASTPAERGAAQEQLGWVHKDLKDTEGMVRHYREAVRENPETTIGWGALGAAHIMRHEYSEALQPFREAIRVAPANPRAWNGLAEAALWHGDLEEARTALEEAIRLRHPSGCPRARLAWVLQQQGHYHAASEQAKRALREQLPKSWRKWVDQIIRDCSR